MVIEHTSQNVEHAKQFLKERILATAAATSTVLCGAEIAMLTYSASEESPEQREMIQDVDSQIGEEAYEHKVANLIRSAYKHDAAHGMEDEWKEHLRALRGEDLYVLTMADRAGVFKDGGFSRHALPSIDTVCLAALGGAGFVFFFTRIGSDAITSAGVRIVLFPLWVAALWAVGEWSRRRIGRR